MPPKSDKNKSNPEKHAELSELWANNLPLKYDDHPCIERDEIVLFALIMFELGMRRAWKNISIKFSMPFVLWPLMR